jgi:hypothetical protein
MKGIKKEWRQQLLQPVLHLLHLDFLQCSFLCWFLEHWVNLLLTLRFPLLLWCYFVLVQGQFYLFIQLLFIYQIHLFPCCFKIFVFIKEFDFCFSFIHDTYFLFRQVSGVSCHFSQITDLLSYILII